MSGKNGTSCVGCKLRRTKCDRKEPICGSCQSINLPVELCQYKALTMGLKEKSPKETVKYLRQTNALMSKECSMLKLLLKNANSSLPAIDKNSSSNPLKLSKRDSQLQFHDSFRPLVRKGLLDNPIDVMQYGQLSWAAPLVSEPHFQEVMTHIREKLIERSDKVSEQRKVVQAILSKDPLINSIKDDFNLLLLGLRPFNTQLLNELISAIELNLPPHNYLVPKVKNFFRFGTQYSNTTFEIDEDLFWRRFHEIISFTQDGTAKINIKIPEQIHHVTFLLVLVPVIFYVIAEDLHRLDQTPPQYNPLAMLEYAKMLSTILMLQVPKSDLESLNKEEAFSRIKKVMNLEHMQSLCLVSMNELFSADDKLNEITESNESMLAIRRGIVIAKIMRLHENIDVNYSEYSKEYRRGLKAIWFYFVLVDISFSFEVGIQSKVRPDEIVTYPDFDNSTTRSIRCISKLLYEFNDIELKNSDRLTIEFVEVNMISKLKSFMKYEFTTIESKLDKFHNYNFENPSECEGFRDLTIKLSMHLDLLSALHSFYSFCLKKAKEQNDHHQIHKFKLLVMKYTMLFMKVSPIALSAYQNVTESECGELYNPIMTMSSMFVRLRMILRRVGIQASAEISLGFENLQSSDIEKSLRMETAKEESVFNEILESDSKHSLSFSLHDLEDFDIEENDNAMAEKFPLLNDDIFILVKIRESIQESLNFLTSKRYNMTFYKMNTVYFLIFKIVNALLILSFEREQKTSHESSQRNSGSNSCEEFDFNDLFKQAFDFTSSKF